MAIAKTTCFVDERHRLNCLVESRWRAKTILALARIDRIAKRLSAWKLISEIALNKLFDDERTLSLSTVHVSKSTPLLSQNIPKANFSITLWPSQAHSDMG
jgi:predicted alpha-1,6-mannanase (GH76 family)